MKKITTVLGLMGVVCFFSACSSTSDDIDEILTPKAEIESSSSAKPAPGSSAGGQPTSAEPGKVVINDSTIVHDTIKTQVIISSTSKYEDPYFSSGVFCWSKECEEKWANVSSSSAPKSSSSIANIEINMSSEAPVYPTVTETQMIDKRDNSTYSLIRIGGVHWMTSNLKYKPKKGFFCEFDGTDYCKTYGTYYTYSAAMSACPTGWRLPTVSEINAADAAQDHEWWTIGGRFKLNSSGEVTDFGLAEDQGYIWIIAEGEYNSWRVKNYDGDTVHDLQGGSTTERAYNVRCVEGE